MTEEIEAIRVRLKTALAGYGHSENRANNARFLISVSEISDVLFEFFNREHSKIADALSEKISKQKEKLDSVKENTKKIKEENKILLEQEREILQKEKEKEALENKLLELRILGESLDKFQLSNPDEIIRELDNEIIQKESAIINKLELLKTAIGVANSDLHQKIKTLSDEIIAETHDIGDFTKESLNNLKGKNTTLGSRFENLNTDYNNQLEIYLTYFSKITDIKEQLEALKEVHAKNLETYNRHFLANQLVWGGLQEKGYPEKSVQPLMNDIESKLKTFDNELKKIIEKRDIIPIHKF